MSARASIAPVVARKENLPMEKNDQIVLVHWIDAHAGDEGGWHGLDPDDNSDYINRTVGFLIPCTEGGKQNHVTIGQSISQEGLYDHVIHIPVIMVRTITHYQPFTKDLTV
jgi:hypothetical protein